MALRGRAGSSPTPGATTLSSINLPFEEVPSKWLERVETRPLLKAPVKHKNEPLKCESNVRTVAPGQKSVAGKQIVLAR